MKKSISLSFSLICLIGCFTPKPAAVPETKQTYTFDYATTETVKPGSNGFVVGLVKPFYATAFISGNTELFKNFKKAIGDDVEELVIAKGFSLKGPYETRDEMIFEDKKRTDMLIQVEVAPAFTAVEGQWKSNWIPIVNVYSYTYSGKASLVGKITLTGIEPLTNEKIWVKSVSIPNIENIPIATSNKYDRPLDEIAILNDPGVYNALGRALQQQYKGIMEKINAHFNAEEFKSLKAQINELKSKRGYN
jgi:hypothetical protein